MSSTPYDRQTSFALFSAENPTEQQSGTTLDAEFNAVKIAIDDTQQNLALIQDDDGALKRGSVGRAQLDASITIGFAAPAQWMPATTYDANVSTVFQNSIFYIANVSHVSGVSFEPAKWDEIADFTAAAIIPDGSITSAKLALGAVTADKIGDGSISNAKLASGAVSTAKLADSAVETTKLADAAVTFSKLGTDAHQIIPAGLGPLPWSLPTLPAGWDWADGGVLLPGTLFPVLRAALIAATFPHGQDGSGNPKKPDARGRVMAGADKGVGRLTTAGLLGNNAVLGIAGGFETITLTTGQIPSHTHPNSLNEAPHTHGTDATKGNGTQSDLTPGSVSGTGTAATVAANTTGITITNAAAGGGAAHNNLQPLLVCEMIIKAH